jgi:hypothetical protein
MPFRIYVDESGTHEANWLIIGMLFVPDHGSLHSALCKVKEELQYLNRSPKYSARYKETHLADFRSARDVEVGKRWIDLFVQQSCYYRCVVIDWSIWDGSYFGDPFEADALKKRRAYKKWAEMLLQPELAPGQIRHARLFLDKLRILYGYDVLDHLKDRFTANYQGPSPYIEAFQHTDSRHDANQCLQLCDLLTGCLYQALVPAQSPEKRAIREHMENALKPFGVQRLAPGFWKQYAPNTLRQHFPKFSAWFWRPTDQKKVKRKGRR